MPSRTERQRRFIFAKRRQYGARSRTPKRWRWVWGEEWSRLAEGRILGPDQHAVLEAAQGKADYAPYTGGDFHERSRRNTEALSRHDRQAISAALSECFDSHRISQVRHSSRDGARRYEVWFQDIGKSRKDFRLTKDDDDWFWISCNFNVHRIRGWVQTLPDLWRCDGCEGVAAFIREVLAEGLY